jgi:hypothetical protein
MALVTWRFSGAQEARAIVLVAGRGGGCSLGDRAGGCRRAGYTLAVGAVLALVDHATGRDPLLPLAAGRACQSTVNTLHPTRQLRHLVQPVADLKIDIFGSKGTAATLAAAGIAERPEAALADFGYWSIDNLATIPNAPELYIPPARHGRQGKPRKDGKPSASKSDGLRAAMKARLASEDGKVRYAKRRETVEPVFGQIKEQPARWRCVL